ncbi:MAG: hypothetical protein RMK76_03315 [Gloeomargarita sp. SKYGB_i_bin116]|nr:hypothetical protein [Gloeomargarita sp. SKYGB_i_bin116]
MVIAQKKYTPQEYLQMEIASEIRHEYRDGEIIAVANNTPHHNRLCGAFYALL